MGVRGGKSDWQEAHDRLQRREAARTRTRAEGLAEDLHASGDLSSCLSVEDRQALALSLYGEGLEEAFAAARRDSWWRRLNDWLEPRLARLGWK